MVGCPECGTSFAALKETHYNFDSAIRTPLPAAPEDFVFSEERQHSWLGLASFLIAFLLLALDVIKASAITVNAAQIPDCGVDFSVLVVGALSQYLFNTLHLSACLLGFGLGLVGFIAHSDRNNLFSWIGLVGNSVVIVAVLGFYVFASLMPL